MEFLMKYYINNEITGNDKHVRVFFNIMSNLFKDDEDEVIIDIKEIKKKQKKMIKRKKLKKLKST